MRKPFLALLAGGLLSTHAFAAEIEVQGEGRTPITADVVTVQALSAAEAKTNAVMAAINKVEGPDATRNPKVQEKIREIVGQVSDDSIISRRPRREGNDFVVTVTLRLDDKKFRTLLSDEGVALNTSAVRSASILAVMDEFFTTETDPHAPLRELIEYKHEAGAHYNNAEAASSSHNSASASSYKSRSSVDAGHAHRSASYGAYGASLDARSKSTAMASGRHGSYAGSDAASVSAREQGRYANASASSGHYRANSSASGASMAASSSRAAYSNKTQAENHDNTYFKKLVEYQPRNKGPEAQSLTYAELKAQLEDYDVKVQDNSLFRSRYFGNKPITLDRLQNSSELAKYVGFVKQNASADFFLIGTSIIIDTGKSDSGLATCDGTLTVQTYSTSDGEDIASGTLTESASGNTSDQCRANVAKKLAISEGSILSDRVQDYWKRRSTYGQQYILTLTGHMNLMTRSAFYAALKKVPGLENAVQRSSTGQSYEVVATYKGSDPIDQAIGAGLVSNPLFSNLDSRIDGNHVLLCMGGCGPQKVGKR